jgi:hypothetical protein
MFHEWPLLKGRILYQYFFSSALLFFESFYLRKYIYISPAHEEKKHCCDETVREEHVDVILSNGIFNRQIVSRAVTFTATFFPYQQSNAGS